MTKILSRELKQVSALPRALMAIQMTIGLILSLVGSFILNNDPIWILGFLTIVTSVLYVVVAIIIGDIEK